MKDFSIAYGSIIGREHLRSNMNNQDAFDFRVTDDHIVGVVCDGCGSSPHSEVGAKIAVKIVTDILCEGSEVISKYLEKIEEKEFTDALEGFLGHTVLDYLNAGIRDTAEQLGKSKTEDGRWTNSQTICDYFLFTTIGFCVTQNGYVVFKMGDGYIRVNDFSSLYTSGDDNAPIYSSYHLINVDEENKQPFEIIKYGKNNGLNSIMIATDGISPIVSNPNLMIPGAGTSVGDVSQFVTKDQFFKNSSSMQRWLNLMNRSITIHRDGKPSQVEHGILLDDTTVVVVRRNP